MRLILFACGLLLMTRLVSADSYSSVTVKDKTNLLAGTLTASNLTAGVLVKTDSNKKLVPAVPDADYPLPSHSFLGSKSITGGSTLDVGGIFELIGDVTTPGANKVYGTDSGGTKGWKDDPAGGGGGGSGNVTSSGTPRAGSIPIYTGNTTIAPSPLIVDTNATENAIGLPSAGNTNRIFSIQAPHTMAGSVNVVGFTTPPPDGQFVGVVVNGTNVYLTNFANILIDPQGFLYMGSQAETYWGGAANLAIVSDQSAGEDPGAQIAFESTDSSSFNQDAYFQLQVNSTAGNTRSTFQMFSVDAADGNNNVIQMGAGHNQGLYYQMITNGMVVLHMSPNAPDGTSPYIFDTPFVHTVGNLWELWNGGSDPVSAFVYDGNLTLSGQTNQLSVSGGQLLLDGSPITGGGDSIWSTNLDGTIQATSAATGTNQLAVISNITNGVFYINHVGGIAVGPSSVSTDRSYGLQINPGFHAFAVRDQIPAPNDYADASLQSYPTVTSDLFKNHAEADWFAKGASAIGADDANMYEFLYVTDSAGNPFGHTYNATPSDVYWDLVNGDYNAPVTILHPTSAATVISYLFDTKAAHTGSASMFTIANHGTPVFTSSGDGTFNFGALSQLQLYTDPTFTEFYQKDPSGSSLDVFVDPTTSRLELAVANFVLTRLNPSAADGDPMLLVNSSVTHTTDNLAEFKNNGTNAIQLTYDGAIKTAVPTGATNNQPIKFGDVANGSVTASLTNYVQVEINGQSVKLIKAN